MFNNALENVRASIGQLGDSICKSIEMLAHAMIIANQPSQPAPQNLFYQNAVMATAPPGDMFSNQAQIPNQNSTAHPSVHQQPQNRDKNYR